MPIPSWRALWYDLVKSAGMAAFGLGWSFRWEGTRHIPKSGPVLVVANHQSFVDPWIVGMSVMRHMTYLARKTLFNDPFFGALIQSLNAVPIDQEGVGKEGIKTIIEQLRLGKAILVFPEGTRTPDGSMQPLKPGVHLLMKRSPAPIVPVGVAGAYDAWPIWRKYPIPAPLFLPATKRTIAVAIGRPLDARRFAELPREESLALLFQEIHKMHLRAEEIRRK
ncbi:MAG: 1-acyl-sn-glycerol-3-phosphate acyltransferase [Gemmataceae bacterium]|nr:1-acyl-sn-glycerol-3-phosphate acyltransferase [Gemmataceae bacterium]